MKVLLARRRLPVWEGGVLGWIHHEDAAAALGAPPPRRLPAWLLRLAAPYVASFAVDTSMRVSNAKAKAELGWQPAFPTYRDGIRAIASPSQPTHNAGGSR